MEKNTENNASGYIIDTFEGIDRNFTEISVVGEWGCGIIAKGKRYGRWWLLKGLSGRFAMEEAYRVRLRKEFETLMMFSHSAIVWCAGMENVDGIGECIVMEYIDGTTLGEWLRTAPGRKERKATAKRLVEAVGYIHGHGVVHRDLKPENIMITRNGGYVKIIDFGLADSDSSAVLKHSAGTLGYISPEQQSNRLPDVRNDIYSLGVVLGEIDAGYGGVVKKCVCEADKRYKDTWAMIRDMRRIDRRRPRAIIGLGLVIAAAVISIALIRTWQTERSLNAVSEGNRSMKTEMAELNDTILRLTEQNAVLKENLREIGDYYSRMEEARAAEEANEARKKVAIEKGKERYNQALAASGLIEHLDTLSNYSYLWPDYSERTKYMAYVIDDYLEELKSEFSLQELREIGARIRDGVILLGDKHVEMMKRLKLL